MARKVYVIVSGLYQSVKVDSIGRSRQKATGLGFEEVGERVSIGEW